MSKRKKFLVTSAVLSLGFISLQFLDNQYRFLLIGILAFLTIVLFAWSLREGLGKNMTLLTLILPFLFTLGVGFFWFLLPANIFTRLPAVLFYAFGIYALCLTANIYTVAAIRTIALLRAARGVGFVLTIATSFLLYDAVLSLRAPIYATSLLVLLASFPLFLQGLWVIPLEHRIDKSLAVTTGVFSLIMAELAMALYFWPVTVVVGSLFLTAAVYMLLGLGQAKLEGRLFSQTIGEYLVVGVLVFIGMFIATRWG